MMMTAAINAMTSPTMNSIWFWPLSGRRITILAPGTVTVCPLVHTLDTWNVAVILWFVPEHTQPALRHTEVLRRCVTPLHSVGQQARDLLLDLLHVPR
jgi:hypothetical protein